MTDWIEDRTRYNEDTLFKVQRALHNAGLSNNQKRDAIIEMQNAGILFRERPCCELRRCGEDLLHQGDCPVYLAILADPENRPVPATPEETPGHEFRSDRRRGCETRCGWTRPDLRLCGKNSADPIHQATPEEPPATDGGSDG